MVKVKFLKSPTGRFSLAYSAGQVGLVSKEIADELVKYRYAEILPADTAKDEKETAINKAADTRETRKRRTTRKK